jgi:hypothetical protein
VNFTQQIMHNTKASLNAAEPPYHKPSHGDHG